MAPTRRRVIASKSDSITLTAQSGGSTRVPTALLAVGAIVCGLSFLWMSSSSRQSSAVDKESETSENQRIKTPKRRSVAGLPVLETIIHEEQPFTQGLIVHDQFLYESNGLYKQSNIRKLNASTGEILAQVAVDDALFAEGIVLWEVPTHTIFNEDILLFSR